MFGEKYEAGEWDDRFARLVEDNNQRLVRFVQFRLDASGLRSLTEDVVQQAITDTYAYLREKAIFPDDEHAALLFGVARRRIIDVIRSRVPRYEALDEDWVANIPSNDVPVELQYEAVEAMAEVRKIVASMPTRMKEVFNRYLDGFTVYEIAEIYSISPKTVSNIISKVRNNIRAELR